MAAPHPSPPFDELTYYPTARWIRGMRGADTVVDTRHAVLVWEPGKHTPVYAFPRQDVRLDASPDLAAATREFDDPDLDGYVTLAWDALEHWYEEDEEVFVHPRDPFVRVDPLEELAPYPRRARRPGAGGVRRADPRVRDRRPDSVLPARG